MTVKSDDYHMDEPHRLELINNEPVVSLFKIGPTTRD